MPQHPLQEEGSRKPTPHAAGFLAYLVGTSVVCGAVVMMIEVLGSRVIGPFFGVSLFVWTSLITVTLVALASGYAAGGIIADRRRTPNVLYALIFAAGALIFIVPFIKAPVLKICLALGLRAGTLLSAALLFGPALFLLGCVSPYVIKIAAGELRRLGRTVGFFSSISTLGSFVGTVVTGFFLIAWFGVSRILGVTGIVLMTLGACYFVIFRK